MVEPAGFPLGSFLFFRTGAVSGRVIRWLQRRRYGEEWYTEANHVAVCVGRPDSLREAVLPRSKVRFNCDVEGRELLAVVTPAYARGLDEKMLKFIFSQGMIRDYSYGLQQILGMLVTALWNLKRNPVRAGRICTEDAQLFKRDMEVWFGVRDHAKKGVDVNNTYPADLLKHFIGNNLYEVERCTSR